FLLERHIERLIDSCAVVGITPPKKELLGKAVKSTVERNKLLSGYVRLNVWKKQNGAGIFVFANDKKFYKENDYKKGFHAVIIKDFRQNENSPFVKVKSLSHYFYTFLGKRAEDLGKDEAIILNSKGNICEGARTNIFIVKNGKIFTPPASDGCLPGVTRKAIMEIAKKLKIDLRQRHIKPEDLLSSNEAFVTNSLIEAMPLTQVDNKLIGSGIIGRITTQVLDKYRNLIRENYK
ncbi:MAG: aminotransferase class IV, partial [Candidatus Omnitrophica bacterium]|nr:aminotransferase class IV [Candidatus Omnitrophota bacterium]